MLNQVMEGLYFNMDCGQRLEETGESEDNFWLLKKRSLTLRFNPAVDYYHQ